MLDIICMFWLCLIIQIINSPVVRIQWNIWRIHIIPPLVMLVCVLPSVLINSPWMGASTSSNSNSSGAVSVSLTANCWPPTHKHTHKTGREWECWARWSRRRKWTVCRQTQIHSPVLLIIRAHYLTLTNSSLTAPSYHTLSSWSYALVLCICILLLPMVAWPPMLTSSSGSRTWNTGGCWWFDSSRMAKSSSGVVYSPSDTEE